MNKKSDCIHQTVELSEKYDELNVKNKTEFCSTFNASWQVSI